MTQHTATLSSTAIARVAWDDDTQEMFVTFTNGRTYTHYGVPEDIYQGLIDAPSAGRFYAQEIRGQYG